MSHSHPAQVIWEVNGYELQYTHEEMLTYTQGGAVPLVIVVKGCRWIPCAFSKKAT